jgi:enterochelin esterase family protein
MPRRTFLIILVILQTSPAFSQTFQDFILRLETAPMDQRPALVDSFMTAAEPLGFPLTEDTLAHFIFLGDGGSGISVPGDFNSWQPAADPMIKVNGSGFYYLTRIFEGDARLDYKFIRNGSQWILDPLNPHTVTGGYGPNSELAMPDYIQPDEIQYIPQIPHGRIETFTFTSQNLQNSRKVAVYLPPLYDDNPTLHYPSLYVHDGGEYRQLGRMPNVLDFLLNLGEIQPVIAIFVDPVDRNDEYMFNNTFVEMIVDELIPHIDSTYRTLDLPEHRCTMGASLGGLVSVNISAHHPDRFGLCASQSGAFWLNDSQMIRTLCSGPVRPVRFYLDWGTYEPSILRSNEILKDSLLARGYSVTSFSFHEGHSWGNWRAHIDNILKTFFPSSDTPVLEKPSSGAQPSRLIHNFPNPFNPATRISFLLERPGFVELSILDIRGRQVRSLIHGPQPARTHSVVWDGRDEKGRSTASGIYLCALRIDSAPMEILSIVKTQ